MKTKHLILAIFLLQAGLSKGQYIVDFELEQNHMLLMEIVNKTDTVVLDTLFLLNIFDEYSYFLNDRNLYVSFSSTSVDSKKSYFINSYSIIDNKITINCKYSVCEIKYKILFDNEIRIKCSYVGLLIYFNNNKTSLILDYKKFNLKNLEDSLSLLSKL